jgi:hypothetical protein
LCGSKIYILVQVKIVSKAGSHARASTGKHGRARAATRGSLPDLVGASMESVDEIVCVFKRDRQVDFLKGSIFD